MKIRFLVVAFAILTLAACESNQPENELEKMWKLKENQTTYVNSCNEITAELKPDSLTNLGCTLIIQNESNEDVYIGLDYFIQVLSGEDWFDITVPDNFSWAAVQWTVQAHDTYTQDINWEELYGKLPDGEYRLIKTYAVEETDSYLVVGFEIPS